MKNYATKIILALTLVVTVFAGAHIYDVSARNEGDNVRIEWKTTEETSLKNFIIERRTPQSSFVEVAAIEPTGNNSFYSYVDKSVYKSNDAIFIYRIKIVDNSGLVSYSSEVSVSLSISGVKKTWGSIKAMFR